MNIYALMLIVAFVRFGLTVIVFFTGIVFFVVKNKAKNQQKPITNAKPNITTSAPKKSNSLENKPDIKELENTLAKVTGTPDEKVLLITIGQCYLNGEFGAPVDFEKALMFFKRLEKHDNVYGKFYQGKTLIMYGLESGEKTRFSQGNMLVYQSYLGGCPLAKDVLTVSAESGFFDNIHSVDELIAFFDSVLR